MIKPVLVLGAEPRIAVTIARSLHRRAIPVDVGVLTEHEPVLSSRAIRRFLRFPRSPKSPSSFLQQIAQQIQAAGYDVLIPCSDSTMAACLSHYLELSRLLHVACPRPEITQRVLNKLYSLEIAERCGIRIPKAYTLLSLADLDASQALFRFPVIAKPKEKLHAGAFKTRRFETYDALLSAFQENSDFGRQNLIQECCTGVGLGIEVLLCKGRAIATFQHRRLKELPSTGGVSVLAVAEAVDPGLLDQSLRLLNALEWDGVAMVEFIFDPFSGAATLMEVNGRYWGSLPLAVQSGIDFPYWHWQLIHGQMPHVARGYRSGLKSRWLCGDFQRLHGLFFPPPANPTQDRWKELIRFIADFRPSTREMLWTWSDPVPAIREFARALRQVTVAHIKSAAQGLFSPAVKRSLLIRRQLGPAAGSIYQRRQIARAFGLIRERPRSLSSNVKAILCVCHGNIIRSPMAAALLRKCLGNATAPSVTSAGLFAELGKPADVRARTASQSLGIFLDQHRAQPLTADLAEGADLILVMDFENEAVLLSRFPQARTKTFLLGAFTSEAHTRSIEIPDPYSGSGTDVQHCFDRLNIHVREFVSLLAHRD
jgi:protein-tyrosine-phosphatase/predicted ATP-grasp superfamily ATP-dependent carboligase